MSIAFAERKPALTSGGDSKTAKPNKRALTDVQALVSEALQPAKPFEHIGGIALFLADDRRSPGSNQHVLLLGEGNLKKKAGNRRSFIEIREGGLNGETLTRFTVRGNPNQALNHAYARTGELGEMAISLIVPESSEVVHQSELTA